MTKALSRTKAAEPSGQADGVLVWAVRAGETMATDQPSIRGRVNLPRNGGTLRVPGPRRCSYKLSFIKGRGLMDGAGFVIEFVFVVSS